MIYKLSIRKPDIHIENIINQMYMLRKNKQHDADMVTQISQKCVVPDSSSPVRETLHLHMLYFPFST